MIQEPVGFGIGIIKKGVKSWGGFSGIGLVHIIAKVGCQSN